MQSNIDIGRTGEDTVFEYLVSMGYEVLCRNYRNTFGEIDIICTNEDCIVFVEVKTRTSMRFGTPSQAVSKTKQMKIIKTALSYITNNKLYSYMCRFDVVEVYFNEKISVNHIKNAYSYNGKYGY